MHQSAASERRQNMRLVAQTVMVDLNLDVSQRLNDLRVWREQYDREDEILQARIDALNEEDPHDLQVAAQIKSRRVRLLMQLVKQPLEIREDAIDEIGYLRLREHLEHQFRLLSKEDRLLWLQNFMFLLVPDVQQLVKKMQDVLNHHSFGQPRCFLLGSPSGSGKTTFLNWFVSNYLPVVEAEVNYVPIAKIDAPVSNLTARALPRRLILEFGRVYRPRYDEETLLEQIDFLVQKCRTMMIIIDEIEHIKQHVLKRRVIDLANRVHLPIVCAACNPLKWIEGDPEAAGRWNDKVILETYKGVRLAGLLAQIELLLPFSEASDLPLLEIEAISKKEKPLPGPAKQIEDLTGGALRDIMLLIAVASARAINEGLPHLTPKLLETTWQEDIQTMPAIDRTIMPALDKNKSKL
jgi:hypothetical protein